MVLAAVASLLERYRISRVAADPPPVPDATHPAGWARVAYFRLHGSPRTYWSRYDENAIATLAATIGRISTAEQVWCVFDNTASGAAIENAWELRERLIVDPRAWLTSGARASLLAPDLLGGFVVAQRNELGVAQVIFARPLQELDLRDQHRLQPTAVLHLRRRQARTPSAALRLREIHERAILDFQPRNFLNSCSRTTGVNPFRVRAA